MKDISIQKIKSAIKDQLMKKDITYYEVAEYLQCSLPTVNRILGPEEIGLTRIIELCELIGISFSELGALVNDETVKRETFSPDQEAFLAKNPNFFAYFMKLQSGDTPKKISEDSKLNQRSNEKYLIGLENQGLIKVSGKSRVRTIFKHLPHLGSGPLGKLYFERIITSAGRFFVDHVRSAINLNRSPESTQFTLMGTAMTRATYLKYVEESEQLFNHYQRISALEEKVKKPADLMVAVLVRGHALVDSKSENLKLLDNTFGEINNL